MSWLINVTPEMNEKLRKITNDLGRMYLDMKDYETLLSGVNSTIKTLNTLKRMLNRLPYSEEASEVIDAIDGTIEVATAVGLNIQKKIDELKEEIEKHNVEVR